MKKMWMLLFMLLLALGLTAQNREDQSRSDNYEPAMYNPNEVQNKAESPFCCFMETSMEYPAQSCVIGEEGIVVLTFTVSEKGELENIKIANSVCPNLDNAVLSCLKKSNENWQPAKLDGKPIASEKKIYINFDIEGNMPHEEMAICSYNKAIEFFNEGEDSSKGNRRYKAALNKLEDAERYSPEQAAIVFWQAKTYEKLRDISAMQNKLDEFYRLVDGEQQEVEIAYITF